MPVREYETDDLGFAAWLLKEGVTMTRHRAGRGKMVWYFDNDNDQCDTQLTAFLNSDCKRFDSFCRDLKKMLRKHITGE